MDLRRSYIELNRVIGLPLTTRLKLTDTMDFVLEHVFSAAEEVGFANKNRTELKISGERIQHDEFKLKEAKSGRLPTVGLMGEPSWLLSLV
jgi:outer membrane protein TolC